MALKVLKDPLVNVVLLELALRDRREKLVSPALLVLLVQEDLKEHLAPVALLDPMVCQDKLVPKVTLAYLASLEDRVLAVPKAKKVI